MLNFVYYPAHYPPELEHLRGEVEQLARGYRYAEHLKSEVPHARLVSDGMLDIAGIAGTPDEVLAKFRSLWRETVGLNTTFFLRPDGQATELRVVRPRGLAGPTLSLPVSLVDHPIYTLPRIPAWFSRIAHVWG